jgi:hypothetical protein
MSGLLDLRVLGGLVLMRIDPPFLARRTRSLVDTDGLGLLLQRAGA